MINQVPAAAPLPDKLPDPYANKGTSVDMSQSTEDAILKSLIKLDESLINYEYKKQPSLLSRLYAGIANHLQYRISEWFSTALLVQFGYILYAPDQVFPHSPNFAVMAQIATEQTWGAICLIVGSVHLMALGVNGTFPGFRFSPHIRAGACFIACFLWFQITLAIFQSGVGGTGFGTYRLVLFLEFWNFLNACRDVGTSEGRRINYGR